MPDPEGQRPAPAPRRLAREARRRQLVAAAMPLAARHGLLELSLPDIAARARVTRNLLYHYFPRGRADVVLAVVAEAERQLTADWTGHPAPAPDQTNAAGLAAMLHHALAPTHAWRIHRMATGHSDPEVRTVVGDGAQRVVEALSRAYFGTAGPPPLVNVALR